MENELPEFPNEIDQKPEAFDIEKAFYDFLHFLKQPKFDWNFNKKESLISLHIIFVVSFLAMMFIAAPLMALAGVDEMDNSLNDIIADYPKYVFVLLAVVLAPLLEELIFRFHLRYPKLGLGLFLVGLTGVIITMLKDLGLNVWLLSAAVIFLGVYELIVFFRFQASMQSIYRNKFSLIFYGTVLVFGFMHVFNYQNLEQWYLAPLLVLPQLLIALFLGYVRVRNGIYISIYFHALYNFIPTSMLLLFSGS